jgi:hypothetical protein
MTELYKAHFTDSFAIHAILLAKRATRYSARRGYALNLVPDRFTNNVGAAFFYGMSNTASAFVQALREYMASLSADDTRVKKQADGLQGDPLHEHLLAGTPQPERQVLVAAQTALANKAPMHISYASAPPSPGAESPIIRRSRP